MLSALLFRFKNRIIDLHLLQADLAGGENVWLLCIMTRKACISWLWILGDRSYTTLRRQEAWYCDFTLRRCIDRNASSLAHVYLWVTLEWLLGLEGYWTTLASRDFVRYLPRGTLCTIRLRLLNESAVRAPTCNLVLVGRIDRVQVWMWHRSFNHDWFRRGILLLEAIALSLYQVAHQVLVCLFINHLFLLLSHLGSLRETSLGQDIQISWLFQGDLMERLGNWLVRQHFGWVRSDWWMIAGSVGVHDSAGDVTTHCWNQFHRATSRWDTAAPTSVYLLDHEGVAHELLNFWLLLLRLLSGDSRWGDEWFRLSWTNFQYKIEQ